jgi:hypothetical protein
MRIQIKGGLAVAVEACYGECSPSGPIFGGVGIGDIDLVNRCSELEDLAIASYCERHRKLRKAGDPIGHPVRVNGFIDMKQGA